MTIEAAIEVGPLREAQLERGRERGWGERMDRLVPGLSGRVIRFAASCSGVGVGYAVKKVLVLRIETAAGLINPVGFDPDYGVFLPWQIGPYKAESRAFAAAVTAVVPGAYEYERPMSWIVRKKVVGRRRENLSCVDVLQASEAVRVALAAFATAVRK